MDPLLQIKNLSVHFGSNGANSPAVNNISFNIPAGKTIAVVGESGSGKSLTALSILKLLPREAICSGAILFNQNGSGQLTKLHSLLPKEMYTIRGNSIAMIFQEPMTSLNPVLTCGFQVMESLIKHKKLNRKQARDKTLELFRQVELPAPEAMINRYPHEISGGQKQRVMIAMAMSCNPELLIADEPTTALDVRVQKNILLLLKKLQQENNLSVLLITHDLGLVADVADEVIVMYKGEIVEQGVCTSVLTSPSHPYTKALLACRPAANQKGKRLAVLKDFLEEKKNYSYTDYHDAVIAKNKLVLSVKNLDVHFPADKNFFGKPRSVIKAVNNVSFDIMQGETVGLVGESGCGKTTLGRSILQLIEPTAGQIILDGRDIFSMTEDQLRKERKELQVVFQDPYGSLNPRITVGAAILEVLKVHGLHENDKRRKDAVIKMLEKVELPADHYKRYPHQFSGGQRQRICIARALSLNPSFLIFDESVSALDVSVQATVLNLINELKKEFNFTSIFISHDLSVVHYISDRIMVMNKGKIVESGTAEEVYRNPTDEYTKQLIESIPGRNLKTT
ncbi:MAG: ABC transporter ATP-binding protein [Bacteroidetes bacterium]|nr:ABC transporter ATP-binding protein [Bacteroidota bacterium]